jgi:hypothetical protein
MGCEIKRNRNFVSMWDMEIPPEGQYLELGTRLADESLTPNYELRIIFLPSLILQFEDIIA